MAEMPEMKTLTIGGVTFAVVDETARGEAQKAGIKSIARTSGNGSPGTTDTYTITLNDGSKKTFSVYNGKDGTNGTPGSPGSDGVTFTPSVDSNGNLSWSNDGGLANPQTVNIKGPEGRFAAVTLDSEVKNGKTILKFTITQENGSIIMSNIPIPNGTKGDKGDPGETPALSISQTETDTGSRIAVTVTVGNQFYTEFFDIQNGKDGLPGAPGSDANVTKDNIEAALGYTPANEAAVEQLSNEKVDKVVDYVAVEAKEVAQKIIENRSINSLVLLMAADIHTSPDETAKTAIKHMGQGMEEIRNHVTPDAVVLLGDYNYGVSPISPEQGIESMKTTRKYLAEATNGITSIWLNGNHDYFATSKDGTANRLSDSMVYALVGSHNTHTVVDADNIGGNYGYIDFEKQRIRLIYLNTTDINGVDYTSHRISNKQGAWFVNTALDLSAKGEDEENWGVVVCTHIPAYTNDQLTAILGNYRDRGIGSAYATSYSFADAKAHLIATFHGHIHNFKVTDIVTSGGRTIKNICIPNAVPNRENPYEGNLQEVDASGNPVAYPKTAGTAEDTSFNAVIIDRDNHKIHAICYGAGCDREIEYEHEGAVVAIVNQIPISTDANGAIYGADYNGDGVKDGYMENTRIGSDGKDRSGATGKYATGFIPITLGDKLYFENCQIIHDETANYNEIVCYKADKSYNKTIYVYVANIENNHTFAVDENNCLTMWDTSGLFADTAFVRIVGNYIGADSIITVNQPIAE